MTCTWGSRTPNRMVGTRRSRFLRILNGMGGSMGSTKLMGVSRRNSGVLKSSISNISSSTTKTLFSRYFPDSGHVLYARHFTIGNTKGRQILHDAKKMQHVPHPCSLGRFERRKRVFRRHGGQILRDSDERLADHLLIRTKNVTLQSNRFRHYGDVSGKRWPW